MKRPMLYWVSLFILGEVLSKTLPMKVIGVITVGMLVLLCRNFPVSHYMKKNKPHLAVGLLFFVLGVVCMTNVQNTIRQYNQELGTKVSFEGIVTTVETSQWGDSYLVAAKGMKLKITLEGEETLIPGERIKGTGERKAFSHATNPGAYDEQTYQYGRGVFLSLQKVKLQQKRRPYISVCACLYRLRKYLQKVYECILEERDASLASAMVLGDKDNLDAEIKQLYQQNGIAHLIAISGLHIAMIGGSLYHLLRKIIGNYTVSAGVGVIFIFLYGMLTGLSGATLRAVIMLIVAIGADVSGRRYDVITAIALALFFMLLKNPYQITQVGFLLSFGAIFGIAVVNPVWKMIWIHMPRYLEGLFVSISVQITTLPIMLWFFYEIPLYGVVLNILVIPLMSLLILVLVAGGILGSVCLPAARIVVVPARWIFRLYEGLCHISEKMPFHTLCTGRPEIWWIVAYYGIVILFLLAVYVRYSLYNEKENQRNRMKVLFNNRPGVVAATGILMGMLFAVFLLPSNLLTCIFDVGQGDGIYIRTPWHHHILVDGGSSSKQKVGTYVLKSGIRYYGGNVLDYVFVSHIDSDHYSGIEELLEDDTVAIRNFVLPAIANPDVDYMELEEKARQKGCRIFYMKKGDELQIDGVVFRCIHPEEKIYEDKNTGSMVLLLSYRKFDMLLTGDMDCSTEGKIVRENLLKQDAFDELGKDMRDGIIEVLKVAHHGSATSTSELFLKSLSLQTACVSVGEKNRYGHPEDEVMERLSRYADKIYLTKDRGAITINTDGKQYQVEPFLTLRNRSRYEND